MDNKPIRVLLIEDNPGDARLLQAMLLEVEAPFELEWTTQLSKGLEMVDQDSNDVVLLDLSLPESQGLATFVRVREHAPRVPIIILSGLEDEAVAMQAVRQGAQDFLIKGQVSGLLLARAIRYAIERKQAQEALRRFGEQQAAMYAVTAAAVTSLDPDQLFATVLDVVLPVLGAQAGWVNTAGASLQDRMHLAAWRGVNGAILPSGIRGNVMDCLCYAPTESKSGYQGHIVSECPCLSADLLAELGLRGHVCIPLLAGEQRLGVLTAAWASGAPVTPPNTELLLTIGRQIGLALHNTRLYQQARQVDRLRVLNELDQALAATLDLDTVAEVTLRHIVAALGADGGIIVPIRHGVNESAAPHGRPVSRPPVLTMDEGWLDRATAEEHPLWGQFLARLDKQPAPVQSQGTPPPVADWEPGVLGVPIWSDRGPVADLVVARRPADRPFSDEDRAAAHAAAARAGQAIRNAQLYDEIRHLLREREETQAHLIHTEKMSAMGRLTASIAHEINNPIQSVLSCLNLASEELDGENRKEKLSRYLHIAEGEIERIANIVRRMRDFYRPAARTMQSIHLHNVLEDVLQLTAKELQHGNIALERQWAEDLACFWANPDNLKQVFLNLVLNAADAMPQGGTLTTRTALDELVVDGRSAPAARVEISDTGQGIPPDARHRLFEPFFTTKKEGSGLGLYISYEIVAAHRGQIRVESSEGQGTTFTILLPIGQGE